MVPARLPRGPQEKSKKRKQVIFQILMSHQVPPPLGMYRRIREFAISHSEIFLISPTGPVPPVGKCSMPTFPGKESFPETQFLAH